MDWGFVSVSLQVEERVREGRSLLDEARMIWNQGGI